jgi:hypothetical protein
LAVSHLCREVMRWIGHTGPREWFIILAAMIIVAVISLRGFGSRSQY